MMLRPGLLMALAVVVLDQLTKWWMMADVLADGRGRSLLPFLDLVVVWNRGVSFGLFAHDWPGAPWALSAIAVAIITLLLVLMARADRVLPALALGAIVGGAAGNVIDRARFGAVFDFVDFHVAGWHFPAFNVADAGISLGVVVLLADGLFAGRPPAKTPRH